MLEAEELEFYLGIPNIYDTKICGADIKNEAFFSLSNHKTL